MTPLRAAARAALAIALAASPPELAAQTRSGSAPPPARLWVAQTSARELTLVWDSVPGATGFRLYQSGSGGDRQIGNVVGRVLRWVVAVKPEMIGASQQFRIETLDAVGLPSSRADFNAVTPIAARPGGPPLPGPATVTARASGDGITVTWDAVPGATAYVLGRAVQPGGFRTLCQLCSTSTTYVDRSPVSGAVHLYSVMALTPTVASRVTRSDTVTFGGTVVAAGGGGTGGTGGTGGAGGTGGTGGTTAVAPLAPTALAARLVHPSEALLTGNGSAGATEYRISRALCGTPATLVASVPSDGSATPGTGFYQDIIPTTLISQVCSNLRTDVVYSITASNAVGTSPSATFPQLHLDLIAIASSLVPVTLALAAPTGLGASLVTANGVVLTWTPAVGATGYQIWRAVCGGPAQSIAVAQPRTLATWQDLIPNAAITQACTAASSDVVYTIASQNATGNSPVATFPRVHLDLGAVAAANAPLPPTGLSISRPPIVNMGVGGRFPVALSWHAAANASAYRIAVSLCGSPRLDVASPGASRLSWTDSVSVTARSVNATCPVGSPDITVEYWIAAAGALNVLSPWASFSATRVPLSTPVYGMTAASPVASLQAVYSSASGSLVLSWSKPLDASWVRVERSLSGGPYLMVLDKSTATTFTDPTAGVIKQNPRYRIVAVNPNGASPPTDFPFVTQ